MRKYIHYLLFLLMLMVALILISCNSSMSLDDYPASYKWNDAIYLIESPSIDPSQAGEEVGIITDQIAGMPEENGESNRANKDSKIYKLKMYETLDKLVIQMDGKYHLSEKMNEE